MNLLLKEKCYALVGAIIRMELDSLMRVHNFNSLTDPEKRQILNSFFDGKRWPNTDRNMVENMPSIMGWTKHIYDFCCAFIHLSPYHDWASSCTIPDLTQDKRRSIVKDIKSQQNANWGYDPTLAIDENFGFDELVLFAPHIFKKLRSNLLLEIK